MRGEASMQKMRLHPASAGSRLTLLGFFIIAAALMGGAGRAEPRSEPSAPPQIGRV